MLRNYQNIVKSFKEDDFLEIKQGGRSFDVVLNIPGNEVEIGDILTIQEVDEEGNTTGESIVKKVSSKLDIEDVELPDYVDREKAEKYGMSIIGWVPPENFALKSVYNYGFTMQVAIDRLEDEDLEEKDVDNKYEIVEGPNYGPPLAAPNFMEIGILNQLNIKKWPIGRYSIVLMIYMNFKDINNAEGEPVAEHAIADIVDALIYACVIKNEGESEYVTFEELETVPLINGKAIGTVSKKKVEVATPENIDRVHADILENQYLGLDPETAVPEETMNAMMEEARRQGAFLETGESEPEDEDAGYYYGMDENEDL